MKRLLRSLAALGLLVLTIGARSADATPRGGFNDHEAVSIADMAIPQIEIKLKVTGDDAFVQSTVLAFSDDATEGFDKLWDQPLVSEKGKVSLFSHLEDQKMAIQALPGIGYDRTIALGFESAIDGEMILDASDIHYFDETAMIVLEDRYKGIKQNLKVNPVYVFDAKVMQYNERFVLHFSPALNIETYSETCRQNDGEIVLDQAGSTVWNWVLTDKQDNLVDIGADMNGFHTIGDLEGGWYMLSLSTNDGYHMVKKVEVPSKEGVSADFFIADPKTVVNKDVQLVNLSTGATDYEWNMGDGSIVTGIKNPQHRYTSEGIFEIQLKASNSDCMDQSMKTIEVSSTPNGLLATIEKDLNIYANNGALVVENTGRINVSELFIHNILGQNIYEKDMNISNSVIKIKLGDLVDGQYLVNLRMDNGQFVTRKVTVKS